MFLRNHEKYKYNSFIFGSSRTLAYRVTAWQQHLPATAHPYKFDASLESIYGIYLKLHYLDSINSPIDNALFVFCRDVTFHQTTNSKDELFIKSPVISGESRLFFQSVFFRTYLMPKFFLNFYAWKYTRHKVPFTEGIIEDRSIKYDTVSNDLSIDDQEQLIVKNEQQYYNDRKEQFYKRSGERTDTSQQIKAPQLLLLDKIKSILDKHHTDYKIVLSPLYEEIRFHPKDLAILNQLFGGRIYDFSGKNAFTEDPANYYEIYHYRPRVGDSIMNLIYK